MVNTAVSACPLGLIHAVIKKPPHTAKKIAESSNLVDFIVNSSVSAANGNTFRVLLRYVVCLPFPLVFVYIIPCVFPIVNTFQSFFCHKADSPRL